MPVSIPHEARALLIRENPGLVALFCSRLGVKIPEGCTPVLGSEDCTTTKAVELTRDRTIVFTSETGTPEFAVCFEVQLRVDQTREWAWPLYQARLRFDLKCPVALLVFTTDPAVAAWCARGFDLGHPGLVLIPLVIGPGDIEAITSVHEAAANIELAVLSALTHGDTPQGPAVLDTVTRALDGVDRDKARQYTELMLASLKGRGKLHLEQLMVIKDFQYTSDFAQRLRAEGEVLGEAQGEAKAILVVLKARGIPITAHARDRVRACTDPRQLELWIERAATIDRIDDLFPE
jgi:hypothetical protein